MKKYIICILFSFSFPYASIYGFGNYAADDSFFITDYSSNYFNFKLKNLSDRETESVFNVSYNIKSSSGSIGGLENSYLSSVSFLFPILNKHFFKFGVTPYTNSDLSFFDSSYTYISADSALDLDAIAYKTNYESVGGISKAYVDYSTELYENFFLGLEYSYSFGNLEQNKEIILYDITYNQSDAGSEYSVDYSLNDSMIIKKIHNFKGHSLKVESKYRFNKNEFIISALYDFPLSIKTRLFYNPFVSSSNESLGIYDDLEQLESVLDANQIIDNQYNEDLKKVVLQYKRQYQDFNYFVLRLSTLNNFNYNPNIMYLPDSRIKSIYLGYESYNPNYRLSSFDYINYKIGVFYKILDSNDYDYGIELNYGINYAENNNMFIALKYGYRTHNLMNFNSEKYYFISFNLENIENWFLKGDY